MRGLRTYPRSQRCIIIIRPAIRETKGWSYGVRAGLGGGRETLSYKISAPVQADRTGDAIQAMLADYRNFLTTKGVTPEELERTQNGDIRELPGAFESANAVLGAMQENDVLILAASLLTGLNSDLPGLVTAQITENAFDSATGRILLVPQGARLIGDYDSVVAFGQRRALVVWKRIIFPDGSAIEVDNLPATDTAGYAGLSDRIDLHSWQLLKGAGLSTLLGVGAELTIGGDGDLISAVRDSIQQNAARTGDQIVSRNLNVQPTLRVRPGWPLRVLISKDLVLKPWARDR